MKNLITTIEEVSSEVKNKISKLGKEALLKKYNSGLLEGQEQVIAARFYIAKRGTDLDTLAEADKLFYDQLFVPAATTQTTTFGKHRSQMKEDEVVEADTKNAKLVAGNKAKRVQKAKEDIKLTSSSVPKTVSEKLDATEKRLEEKAPKEDKIAQMKLTAQEFALFEQIKVSKSADLNQFQVNFASLREFKGVLSSLAKKDIISYDQDEFKILPLGLSMMEGSLGYKQKNKHEQNDFKKARIVVEIDGKPLEKSAYVRSLLRKNNKISCAELNITLAKVGFPKLYHSELQRCKEQLGIVTEKDKD